MLIFVGFSEKFPFSQNFSKPFLHEKELSAQHENSLIDAYTLLEVKEVRKDPLLVCRRQKARRKEADNRSSMRWTQHRNIAPFGGFFSIWVAIVEGSL